MADKIDVLRFMMLRTPSVPDPVSFRRSYVRDDVAGPDGRRDEDLFSVASPSPVGRQVYDAVYCAPGAEDPAAARAGIAALAASLLSDVEHFTPACPNEPGGADIGLLRDRTYVVVDGVHHLPPDRAADLHTPYGERLGRLQSLLELAATPPPADADGTVPPLDVAGLHRRLAELLGAASVRAAVFTDDGSHTADFRLARRALFDTLYLLYVLRRVAPVRLEPAMDALGALHALEAIAVDGVLADLGGVRPNVPDVPGWLVASYPELERWGTAGAVPGFPLVASHGDLRAHLDAMPVVHPVFARLHRFRHPFNDLTPVGVGDLKVVKQWLLGYRAGEISHIDNVLRGETKSRVHRHLEKTEEVFSLTGEQQEETTRDTQTTDRFEIKREAEYVLTSDLDVKAGIEVQLSTEGTGYKVVSTVTGGLASTRSQSDQAKVASTFARDVVDKAVTRVQSRVSRTRTSTTLSETEETNTHTFDNTGDDGHISGLYRWLDKEYRSQVYDYGRRMMFEFVLPEPAAFLVEARLRAYETALEVPQPPARPALADLPQWVQELTPASVTPERFEQLRGTHDLADLEYPRTTRWVDFTDAATGRNYFSERGVDSTTWQGRTYTCRLGAKDYTITNLVVQGYVYFWGTGDTGGADENTVDLRVDGWRYLHDVDNAVERWYYGNNRPADHPATGAPPLADDQVTLFLGFWDVAQYDLSIHAELALAPQVLAAWQARVVARVRAAERKHVDAVNAEREQSYQSRLATYRSRIGELRATAVNDLLQGRSEAANRALVVRELKRQCLAMLTREFDADPGDDTITPMEATAGRPFDMRYRQLRVTETPDAAEPRSATAAFDVVTRTVDYPVPDLRVARDKGRYVQFLEQAFEWQQLSYVCYPYFWASPPSWVELMARSDDGDPFLTAFLQAGSVRVLVAVTPAHDDAVLHYLATGEPWDGGPAPVIGDPLYLPLYEELRRQQDDLVDAVPAGEPWTFTLPTSLVYLQDSSTPLPAIEDGTGP